MPSIVLYNGTEHSVEWLPTANAAHTTLRVPSGQVSTSAAGHAASSVRVCASTACSMHNDSFVDVPMTRDYNTRGSTLPFHEVNVRNDAIVRVVPARQHDAAAMTHLEVYPFTTPMGDVQVVNGLATTLVVSNGMWGETRTLRRKGDTTHLSNVRALTVMPTGDQSIQFATHMQQGSVTSPSKHFVVDMAHTGHNAWTATVYTAHDWAKHAASRGAAGTTTAVIRNVGEHPVDFTSDDPSVHSVRIMPGEMGRVPAAATGTLRYGAAVTKVPRGLAAAHHALSTQHNVHISGNVLEFGGSARTPTHASMSQHNRGTNVRDDASSTTDPPAGTSTGVTTSTNPTFKQILQEKVAAYTGLGLAGTAMLLIIASIIVYSAPAKNTRKSKTSQAMLLAGVGLIALAAGTVLLVHAYMRAQDKLKTSSTDNSGSSSST